LSCKTRGANRTKYLAVPNTATNLLLSPWMPKYSFAAEPSSKSVTWVEIISLGIDRLPRGVVDTSTLRPKIPGFRCHEVGVVGRDDVFAALNAIP